MFVVQLPHVPSPTVCLFSVSHLLHLYFLLFPSISIDVGATYGVFLACFQIGFLLCDHGLDFEIGLCENSINQSINVCVCSFFI